MSDAGRDIFTFGHSGRACDVLPGLLKRHGVMGRIGVRKESD